MRGVWSWSEDAKEGVRGENNERWKGGEKVWLAKRRAKRRERGFQLISKQNPYDEPIEYHHIHPELPYVVPCPTRIHRMFKSVNKTHFDNVNIMLGIKFDFLLIRELFPKNIILRMDLNKRIKRTCNRCKARDEDGHRCKLGYIIDASKERPKERCPKPRTAQEFNIYNQDLVEDNE